MHFGKTIKQLRIQNNLSQEKLSLQLKISQSKLSKLEDAEVCPFDFYMIINLCIYLKLPLSSILNEEQKDFLHLEFKKEDSNDTMKKVLEQNEKMCKLLLDNLGRN